MTTPISGRASSELNLEPAASGADASPVRRTALFDSHSACGGKMVTFAGWEMPVQYAGVGAETRAVRENCGIFDVGHMGQLDVRGEGVTGEGVSGESVSGESVTDALNFIVSADWSKTAVGRAAYALLLTQSGGVLDDVMGYRLSENHWLLVVNASRAEIDEAQIRALLPAPFSLSSRIRNQSMIAVQGPRSEAIFQAFCAADLSQMALRDVVQTRVLNRDCVLTRGGYTGCDGFEWMGDAQSAPLLWQKLLEAGAVPCGLGARDVLRLEAGLPLYGHELREDLTPDESGVAFAVQAGKGDFFGREALLRKRETGTSVAVRGLQMLGRGIAREGYLVEQSGETVGVITSGTPSPTLASNIALALLPRDLAPDTEVQVVIRGAAHPARIAALPFVTRTTKTTSS